MKRLHFPIGTQFGLWTVSGEGFFDKDRRRTLIPCTCKCGFRQNVRASALKNGSSGGCLVCKQSNPPKILAVGEKFGRWTVIEPCFQQSQSTYAPCICECGKKQNIRANALRNGKSSGCPSCQSHTRTHGDYGTSENNIWHSIRQRCENPHSQRWKRYGGRGIGVCERWRDSYENFLADMGRRPGPEYSIERRDNDGDYTPDNCYWATPKEQSNNTRRQRTITFNGTSIKFDDWADVIWRRLTLGWPPNDVLNTPIEGDVNVA